jgi:preprotein translocase subunit SecF
VDFFRKQNWDIVGKSWLWLGISAIIIVFGMVWWGTHRLNLGIDFTGGTLLRYQLEQSLSGDRAEERQVVVQVRNILRQEGLGKAQIQISGNNQIFVRVPQLQGEEDAGTHEQTKAIEKQLHADLTTTLSAKYGAVTNIGREKVGPVVGKQLRDKALYALVLGSVLILIFITIRYEFRFAVAAILALVHDVLIMLAAMTVLQVELDSAFVAALLTVIGYSINDTVVIFDRIRENRKLRRTAPFEEVVNASLMQTMTRSINTTLTTLFALIALYGWGGTTIRGFALALIIGITSGAYSSVFTASPILVLWNRRTAARKGTAAARTSRAARTRGRTATAEEAAVAGDVDEDELAEVEDEKASASDTIRQAEAKAREEKRQTRKDRRKKSKKSRSRRF